jgi:hypothetical protein
MTDQSKPRESSAPEPKRQYRRPALVEYGPISKLTRTGGQTRVEPTGPAMRLAACL